jgi:hypothetical protein
MKRSLVLMAAGAAGAAAALVASPGAYEALRRLSRRASDRHHYETDVPDHEFADHDGEESEEPGETDALRLSLRARLAESAGPSAVVAANADAASSDGVDAPPDAVDEARARVRAKARAARDRIESEGE